MMTGGAEADARPAAAADTSVGVMKIFEGVVRDTDVAACREVLGLHLGSRPDLGPGQRDAKWWINFGNLVDAGATGTVKSLLARFCATPLFGWARTKLGPDLVFVLDYCIMRRFEPRRRPVPAQWHFDANIFGLTTPMVNFWMPLVDVGRTAPGLTLVDAPRRPARLWNRMQEIADERGGVFDQHNRRKTLFTDDEVTAALAEDEGVRLVTPQVKAGGAIAFDHQYLHGTQTLTPEMGLRDSLEIRVMPLETAVRLRLPERYKVMKATGTGAG